MNNKYLEHIALVELTSVQCYKIILLLLTKTYTQAQLSVILEMKNQNTLRYMRELESKNLIEIDRIEGRNRFYRAVTDLEKIKNVIPGQIKI